MQLKDIANITMGQSPAGTSLNEIDGIEFHQGKVYFGDLNLLRSPIKTTAPSKFAYPGDIVVCVRAPVGEVNLVSRKICIGRGLAALTAKDGFSARFLLHLLRYQKNVFDKISSGSTFASITTEQLKEISFTPPSATQQHHIASTTRNTYDICTNVA